MPVCAWRTHNTTPLISYMVYIFLLYWLFPWTTPYLSYTSGVKLQFCSFFVCLSASAHLNSIIWSLAGLCETEEVIQLFQLTSVLCGSRTAEKWEPDYHRFEQNTLPFVSEKWLLFKFLLISLKEPQLWSLHLPVTACSEGRGETNIQHTGLWTRQGNVTNLHTTTH